MEHIYLKDLNCLPKMFLNYFLYNQIESIVDFGCGYGFWFYILQKNHLLPKTAVGIDADPLLCHYAVGHIQKINVIQGDATKVNFANNPFDLAVCNQTIEHTEDDEALVKNIYTSLKPNGVLYITSIIRKPGAWYIYAYHNEPRLSPMHIKEYNSIEEFVALLQRHKFKILQAQAKQYRLKFWSIPLIRGKLSVPIPKFYTAEALVIKPNKKETVYA